MILPQSTTVLILLMFLCLVCWGSWPVFSKLAKQYRFELFYFDFAIGLGIFTLLCVFTVGSRGFDGFIFQDDLLNARTQDWLYAFGAGLVFNFGNMMMMSAISVAGMAVAFPLTFGVGLIVNSWLSYAVHPGTNTPLLFSGTVLIGGSLVAISVAYSHLRIVQHERLARAGKTKSTRRPNSMKAIVLAAVGGLGMGTFLPLLHRAQDPDQGVGPYALLFLFAAGIAASTFVLNLFFMNLPVEGEPLEIGDYFKAVVKSHLAGVAAGVVWGLGAIAYFVATTPQSDHHLGPPLSLLGQAAPVIAGLWGLLIWKEFKGGDMKAKGLAAVMLVLFAGGVALFAYAPLWITRP